jgi:hypothetical protein
LTPLETELPLFPPQATFFLIVSLTLTDVLLLDAAV